MVIEKVCSLCQEKFLTSLPIQVYCTGYCRRKTARNKKNLIEEVK